MLERVDRDHEGRPLVAGDLGRLLATNDAMASAGLRVIAVAAGPVEASTPEALRGRAFMTLGMSQTFHLVNARRRSAVTGLAHLSNPYAVAGVIVALCLQLLPVFIAPLGAALHVARLGQDEWLVIAMASVAPAVIGQTLRALRRRQNG